MVLTASLVVWGLFFSLAIRLRRDPGDVLQRVSLYLYKKIHIYGIAGKRMKKRNMQLVQNLISLHPGVASEFLLQEYHVSKIRILLLILLIGCAIGGCTDVLKNRNGDINSTATLVRPKEKETVTLEARVEVEGEGVAQETFSLEVGERILTEAEAEEGYEELLILLEDIILGKNASLLEVRNNLELPYEVKNYPFLLEWKSSDPSLLGFDGSVFAEDLETYQQVTLTMTAFYQQKEWSHSWEVNVYPPLRTEKEQLLYELKKLVKETEENQRYEENILLPQFIRDKKIYWSTPKDNTGEIILLVTIFTGIIVFYMKDKDLAEELVKRRRIIKIEYPVIVSKYAVLLEAGMTVRGGFYKNMQ